MNLIFAAFFSAILFGLGLGISGMTNPAKVLGFLDVFGKWDPSLLFVMAGAVIVHSLTFRWITKRKSPVVDSEFRIPALKKIDRKLILGSFLFGVGWGLCGICPGPSIVDLATANLSIIIFVICMLAGIYIHQLFLKQQNEGMK